MSNQLVWRSRSAGIDPTHRFMHQEAPSVTRSALAPLETTGAVVTIELSL
jgi:hypothetical protein